MDEEQVVTGASTMKTLTYQNDEIQRSINRDNNNGEGSESAVAAAFPFARLGAEVDVGVVTTADHDSSKQLQSQCAPMLTDGGRGKEKVGCDSIEITGAKSIGSDCGSSSSMKNSQKAMDDNNGVLFYGTELEEHVKQIKNLLGIGYNARVLIDSSFIQWAVRRNQDLFHSMETLIHSPTDFFITKCVTQSVSLRAWYRDVCSFTAEMRQMFGKMDALPSLCNHSFDYLDEHLCILQVLKNSINKGCFLASCEEKVYDFVQQALTTPIVTVDDEGNLQVLPLTDLQLKRISGEEKSVKTDVVDKENDLWFGFSQDEVIEYDKEEGINTTEEENALVVEEIRKRSSYTLRDLGFSSDESS